MGTDCGIAILHKDGIFEKVSLDRYWVFQEAYTDRLWVSQYQIIRLISKCVNENVSKYKNEIIDFSTLGYSMAWVVDASHTTFNLILPYCSPYT